MGLRDVIEKIKNSKELKDSIKDIKKGAKELHGEINTIKGTSLAKLSSAATLQFPIIISRAVNVDTAQAVSKALERQYASFVQIVVSMNPVLDLKKDENITGYLRKFHQNNIGPNDLLESSMSLYTDEENGVELFMSINEGCNAKVLQSNKDQLFRVEDCLNMNSVNNLYKPESVTLPVAESSLDYFCKKNNIVMEDNKIRLTPEQKKKLNDAVYGNNTSGSIDGNKKIYKNNIEEEKLKYQKERDKELDARDEDRWQHKLDMDEWNKDFKERELSHEIEKDEAEFRSKAMVRLADNDVKKSNELVPTTLSLSLNQISDQGRSIGIHNFIIGVKGLMHPVNSNEIISNLLDGFKSGNKFFNFIRWTTGEIKFVKDLLFNVSGIKDDVIKKHSGGSHWWTTLKRRRKMASAINAKQDGRRMLPNASIVCTMEEIVEMQEVYKINLLDVRHIKKIMDRYYLLGFVIVDESQELCHIIFDGEDNYQVLTYKGLEKENNSKNDFKDIYRMINSGRL